MKTQSTTQVTQDFFNQFISLVNQCTDNISKGNEPSFKYVGNTITGKEMVGKVLINYLSLGIKNGKFDLKASDPTSGNNWLHYAVSLNDPRLIKFFLDHKVDLNKTNKQGETPLQKGIKENGGLIENSKPESVDSMLANYADLVKSKTTPSLVWEVVRKITSENYERTLEVFNIFAKHGCDFGDKGWVAQHKKIAFANEAGGKITVEYDYSTQAGMQIGGGIGVILKGAHNPSYDSNLLAPFFFNYNQKTHEITLTQKTNGGFSMGGQEIKEVVRKECPAGETVYTPFTYLCNKFIAKETTPELKEKLKEVATDILRKQISLNQFDFDFRDNDGFIYVKCATLFFKSPEMIKLLIEAVNTTPNSKQFYDDVLCNAAQVVTGKDDTEEFVSIIKTLVGLGADIEKALQIALDNSNNVIIEIMAPLLEEKIKELQAGQVDKVQEVQQQLAVVNLGNPEEETSKELAGKTDDDLPE